MKKEWALRPDQLSSDQVEAIVKNPQGNYATYGPAGSGKTNVLLLRARYLNKISESKDSVQCLVFTGILKKFLRKGMVEYGLNGEMVQTFHGWGYKLLQGLGINVNRAEDFDSVARRLMPHIEIGDINKIDYLLVDEAQDFKPDVIELFFKISHNLCLFFDNNQTVFGKQPLDQVFPEAIRPFRSRINEVIHLKKAYRTPRLIAELATSIFPKSELTKHCINEDKVNIAYERFDNELEERKWIKNMVDEIRIDDSDATIGIIRPGNRLVLSQEYDEFKRVSLSVDAEIYPKSEINWMSNNPKLCNYYNVKGLEFDAVFMSGANSSNFPGNRKDAQLAYVGVTRTKRNLFISASGPIAFCLNPPRETNFKQTIDIADLF